MKSLRDEIAEKGFTFFSIERNRTPNYYPGAFNDYPGVSMNYLKLNDMITVKAFYIQESDPQKMLNDSYIELLVNEIGADTVQAIILTPLPSEVPLKRGDVLQIQEEEILYSVRLKDVPRSSRDDTKVH